MQIGNKVKKLRELRNYTQQYMADRLAMTSAGYSKIERDEVSITFDKLEKISEILDIPLNKLIEFDDKAFFQNATFNGNYNGIVNHGDLTINEKFDERINTLEERIKQLEQKLK